MKKICFPFLIKNHKLLNSFARSNDKNEIMSLNSFKIFFFFFFAKFFFFLEIIKLKSAVKFVQNYNLLEALNCIRYIVRIIMNQNKP